MRYAPALSLILEAAFCESAPAFTCCCCCCFCRGNEETGRNGTNRWELS